MIAGSLASAIYCMPVQLPDGFGPRESMSFFMYDQDGQQAVARLIRRANSHGRHNGQTISRTCRDIWNSIAGMISHECALPRTSSISSTFIAFVYLTGGRKCWLTMRMSGTVQSGCLEDRRAAFNTGAELKVAIRGLCSIFQLLITATNPNTKCSSIGIVYYLHPKQASSSVPLIPSFGSPSDSLNLPNTAGILVGCSAY